MLDVREADERIREALPPPRRERVPLGSAAGRILAEAVRAPFPLPRFTNSAMDGFAVRARDTSRATRDAPVHLRLRGEAAAGHPSPCLIGSGECVRCMTGAPLPVGADAVVMVEDTSGFEGRVRVLVYRDVRPGKNVRLAGEEVHEGEVLLSPGVLVGPVERGILASLGFARVSVFRRPAVAVLATGDEIVEAGRSLRPGEIHDANLVFLSDLLRLAGARVVRSAMAGDDPRELRSLLRDVLGSADLLVVSGGVSVGRHDHVPAALSACGVKERFHGVAQQPGKPLYFGTKGGAVVFGLPGNPISALMCCVRYVEPAVGRMAGREPPVPFTGRLAAPFPRLEDRHRFQAGRAHATAGGMIAVPAARSGPHMLTSALGSNCLLSAAPGMGPLPEGSPVEVWPVPWARCPETTPRFPEDLGGGGPGDPR